MKETAAESATLETTREVFDLWLKAYEDTVGKMLNVPAVGPAREKVEKIMQGVPRITKYYASWMDTNLNFQTVFMEAMRKTREKLGEATPENYRDFYSIWLETYSDTFKDFLKSGHFANDIGKYVADMMDVGQYNKEMLEMNVLKPMNVPTKSEIDEIHKELYLLKKKVKELNRQVKSLTAAK